MRKLALYLALALVVLPPLVGGCTGSSGTPSATTVVSLATPQDSVPSMPTATYLPPVTSPPTYPPPPTATSTSTPVTTPTPTYPPPPTAEPTVTPQTTPTPSYQATPTPAPATATPYPAPASTAIPGMIYDATTGMPVTSYLTPNDPTIQNLVNEILRGGFDLNAPNILQDWVASHITYKSDQEVHGVSPGTYWQLPEETLRRRTGDCKDFSTLLCTLLRADGVPADQVYVGLGYPADGTMGHAFLFEHYSEGIWRAIEPQETAWTEWFLMGDLDISSYSSFYHFNDQQCLPGKPTLPRGVYEFMLGSSLPFITSDASVGLERYLNAGETVTGDVQWYQPYQIVLPWILTVYGPQNDAVLTWSGTDLEHDVSFTASQAGKYKVEVLKGDCLPRAVRIMIEPTDWQVD